MSSARERWELDPASADDYEERLDAEAAQQAGDRFRQWLRERVTPASGAASTQRTVPQGGAAHGS